MREKIIDKILQEKIIVIIRGVAVNDCIPLADALYEGGIRLLEFTFDQKNSDSFRNTAESIKIVSEKYDGKMYVGAGTVTTPELVDIASSAGAKFIISPDTNVDVIKRTVDRGLVSIPGALTPTEILTAHRAGADFVKLFPIDVMGTSYVKSVCAPINHVRFLGVGGINENNAAEFIKAGVMGVGVGGNIVNRKMIENGDFSGITEIAKRFISSIS